MASNEIAFMFAYSELPGLFGSVGGNLDRDRSARKPFYRWLPTTDRFELRTLIETFAGGCVEQRQAKAPARKNHFHDLVAANRWTVEAATIQVPYLAAVTARTTSQSGV